MRIKKIKIENFRSIKKEELIFPENGLLSLIGPNNAGKSNFLRAIDLICGEFWAKEEKLEDYDFYGGNRDVDIKIEIIFDDGKRAVYKSDEKWPTYLDERGRTIYASQGSIKEDFPCTYLSAERSVAKEISFSKWSLMGKVSKSFNTLMKSTQGVEERLKQKFEEVQTIFDKVENFKKFKEMFAKYFNEMQSDSPYKLKIDFKPFTPNNYFKTINILAEDPNVANLSLDLEELGDGAKNLVILSLLRSYAMIFRSDANGILAIEEPEIYLHPQARRHLYRTLKEIAQNSNIQIIYTTHDPAFLSFYQFDSIRRVYKIDDEEDTKRQQTQLIHITKDKLIEFADKTGFPKASNSHDKVVEHYRSISNFRLTEAFFSRLVILVEGSTEELALPVYLKTSGIECDKLGISILGVSGKGEIAKYWRLFYCFKIPLIVVFDNDNDTDSNQLLADCFNTDVKNIISSVDVYKKEKFSKKGVFQQTAVILELDFETALSKDAKTHNIEIDDLRASAKSISYSKNVQARWIALKLQQDHSDYVPSFVVELKSLIENQLHSKEQVGIDVEKDATTKETAQFEDIPF